MRTVVCIGGGRFGSQAATRARDGGARVLVVDNDERCPARRMASSTDDVDAVLGSDAGEVLFYRGDGPSVLLDILDHWIPDLVVPASRGHLAAQLAVEHCRRQGRGLVPYAASIPDVESMLPPRSVRSSDRESAVIVTSFMEDGQCADGCPQTSTCPVTGEELPPPMHELIAGALSRTVDRHTVLVTFGRSVGGMAGLDLRGALSALDESGRGEVWGIATACRCHGIINLLQIH